MDYFTKSETSSAQWPVTYAGNKLYLHKNRKSLLITNINHSLGDSVAEGTVSESKCHFQHLQDKRHLQTPQKTPNGQKLEYSTRNKIYKSFSETMETNKKNS